MSFFNMNDIKTIFCNFQFLRLWLAGTSSGIARWLEVMCFSVFAWQITKDATIAGYLMTLRLTGVLIASVLFLFIGGPMGPHFSYRGAQGPILLYRGAHGAPWAPWGPKGPHGHQVRP